MGKRREAMAALSTIENNGDGDQFGLAGYLRRAG